MSVSLYFGTLLQCHSHFTTNVSSNAVCMYKYVYRSLQTKRNLFAFFFCKKFALRPIPVMFTFAARVAFEHVIAMSTSPHQRQLHLLHIVCRRSPFCGLWYSMCVLMPFAFAVAYFMRPPFQYFLIDTLGRCRCLCCLLYVFVAHVHIFTTCGMPHKQMLEYQFRKFLWLI